MESNFLKHLFQHEFSRMVAVISKLYGLRYIEIAEDIVSETFLTASETWNSKGVPVNPTAWLYSVAKQKTLYHFRRHKIYEEKVIPAIRNEDSATELNDPDFSDENIKDSQLQMMFAICDPAIASEAQIGLALRILCGFGIDEIAEAFLSNKETINKRLFRAKEKLREEKIEIEMPSSCEITKRLDAVLHIIYLLFSEGYYSTTQNQILQKDLCLEAMRLGMMLTEYGHTNTPKTNALMALMCFHASRFDSRQAGEVLYEDQNELLWDATLINQGIYYLENSAEGMELSSYHLEARIAYWHCVKEDTQEKWEEILQLYNELLMVNYSPSVALNRTYALFKANNHLPDQEGQRIAIREAEKLKLDSNHFYFVLLGELYHGLDNSKAKESYQKALALVRTETERKVIYQKINAI